MAWQWSLNWNEVREDMVVGSCPMRPADLDEIKRNTGCTALLSLQTDECRGHFGIDYGKLLSHGRRRKLAMVNTPMLDFNDDDQRRNLPEAVSALHEMLAAGHRVYVHCTAGLNRAPLTVLGYLTFVEMLPVETAATFIAQARAGALPSWVAYHGCRADLIEALRDHIYIRSYYLAEEHPERDPDANWFEAERQVLRGTFINARLFPRRRLDPSRES